MLPHLNRRVPWGKGIPVNGVPTEIPSFKGQKSLQEIFAFVHSPKPSNRGVCVYLCIFFPECIMFFTGGSILFKLPCNYKKRNFSFLNKINENNFYQILPRLSFLRIGITGFGCLLKT